MTWAIPNFPAGILILLKFCKYFRWLPLPESINPVLPTKELPVFFSEGKNNEVAPHTDFYLDSAIQYCILYKLMI